MGIDSIVFVLGLFIMGFVGDKFVSYAVKFSRKINISAAVIGATIVPRHHNA